MCAKLEEHHDELFNRTIFRYAKADFISYIVETTLSDFPEIELPEISLSLLYGSFQTCIVLSDKNLNGNEMTSLS